MASAAWTNPEHVARSGLTISNILTRRIESASHPPPPISGHQRATVVGRHRPDRPVTPTSLGAKGAGAIHLKVLRPVTPVGKESAPWLSPGPSPPRAWRLADNPVRSADGRQVPRIDHPWRGLLPAYFGRRGHLRLCRVAPASRTSGCATNAEGSLM